MKKSKLLLGISLVISLLSCGQKQDFNSYINTYYEFSVDTISVEGFKSIKEQVKVIDARSLPEYSTSKIHGAIFLDYDNPKLNQLQLKKSDTIVVYCTIGYRSEKIAEKLQNKGYAHVYNLYGGIIQWVNDSNPVFSPTGSQTPYVHTYDATWGKWLVNPKIQAVD